MLEISMKEARRRFRELLDRAELGEEIIVLRRGKAVAKLVPVGEGARRLPKMAEFRDSIGRTGTASAKLLREERERR